MPLVIRRMQIKITVKYATSKTSLKKPKTNQKKPCTHNTNNVRSELRSN